MTTSKPPKPKPTRRRWHHLFALLSILLLGATTIVSVQPQPAAASTADHFVRTIYLVPKDAPNQDRADVMMNTMRAVQREWSTWGWTFELEPGGPKVIRSEKTCAQFNQPGHVPNEVAEYYPLHDPNIVTVIFAECAGGAVGISWGDFAVIFHHIARRLDRGGPLQKSMTGAVSHELGHNFGLGHVQCSPKEWGHTGPMCAGGFAKSDPSREQSKTVFSRRCEWIQECSGGPKHRFTRADDQLLVTDLYVDAALTSTSAGGSDFNGDGKDDILWYGPGGETDTFWNGTSRRGSFANVSTTVNGADYLPINGNFDSDEADEIILYNPRDGSSAFSDGPDSKGNVRWTRLALGVAPGRPHVGDFNGDGQDDIFWYAPGPKTDAIWYGTRNPSTFRKYSISVSGFYEPVIGDFDSDGFDDILWFRRGGPSDPMWFGSARAKSFARSVVNISGSDTPIAGDFNGDGFDDVFFYGEGSQVDSVAYGTSRRGRFNGKTVGVSGKYRPLVGDFDGDGKDDIYWYSGLAREDSMWFGAKSLGTFTTSHSNHKSLGISILAS